MNRKLSRSVVSVGVGEGERGRSGEEDFKSRRSVRVTDRGRYVIYGTSRKLFLVRDPG